MVRVARLVRTGVQELSKGRNITNKISRGLLDTLRGYIAEREAQLTFDGLLKRPMRGTLSRSRRSSILLPIALPPIDRSREMEAADFMHVLMDVIVVVKTSVAMRMAPITAKIRVVLILGNMSKRLH